MTVAPFTGGPLSYTWAWKGESGDISNSVVLQVHST